MDFRSLNLNTKKLTKYQPLSTHPLKIFFLFYKPISLYFTSPFDLPLRDLRDLRDLSVLSVS